RPPPGQITGGLVVPAQGCRDDPRPVGRSLCAVRPRPGSPRCGLGAAGGWHPSIVAATFDASSGARRGMPDEQQRLAYRRRGSGIVRPVGPGAAEPYWRRRALVVGAFLVLLIIIRLFLFTLGGRPGQAAPAGTPSVAPTGNASSDSSTETSAAPSSASSGSPS